MVRNLFVGADKENHKEVKDNDEVVGLVFLRGSDKVYKYLGMSLFMIMWCLLRWNYENIFYHIL